MSPYRPLLFLDVDGPLLPFGAPTTTAPAIPDGGNPLLSRLDPDHGTRLRELPCELVWATTWGADANEELAPRLGLPNLPVVVWPDEDEPDHRLHWKTRTLVGWAAGRPFAWVDDEIGDADRRWVATHHPGPALLHRVDPALGLTGADFATISTWLESAPQVG